MGPSGIHYFPLAWPFILILVVALVIVIALIEFRLLKYAYERMGIPGRYVTAILLFSLLGSYVNLPVYQLPGEEMVSPKVVEVLGVQYVVPEVEKEPGTIVAVNVGGALIPVLLSIYLVIRNRLFLRGAIAVVVVAAVVHFLARPVKGVGITVPTFVPPLVAAATAMILAWRQAPPLAYIGGSLGTLIGADLLNLDKIQGLGAPVASIGGAGTFDAVFLTGILAVLLSPVAGPPREEDYRSRRSFRRDDDDVFPGQA
jgi:uncharacterized membrane protein